MREKRVQCVLWAAQLCVMFALLFVLFSVFPLSGDDWLRENLGESIHGLPDLIREIALRWSTTNPRIFGNLLAYTAGGRRLLNDLMRTGFTLALGLLLARAGGFRTRTGALLAMAAVLTLPRSMFREIYPWCAGFYNYVPPVVLLLAFFCLAWRELEHPERPLPAADPAGAVLGFAAQLFIENDSLFALAAAAALLVLCRIRRGKITSLFWAFFAGCAAGMALLLASPSYRLVAGEGAKYSFRLAGLLSTMVSNVPVILRSYAGGVPAASLPITALACAAFWRSPRREITLDRAAAAVLALTAVGFAAGWTGLLPLSPVALLVLTAGWFVALAAGCFRWLEGAVRDRALFYILGSAVAAAPLAVVSPIGPRCLFISCVLLMAGAESIACGLFPAGRAPRRAGAGAACLCAGVFVFWLWVYLPSFRIYQLRQQLCRDAVAGGQTQVCLPSDPEVRSLWDNDTQKLGGYYYLQQPNDISFTFLPYDQWLEQYGGDAQPDGT